MNILFSSVQGQFKFSKYIGKLNVDNGALKLQYRFMAPLMLAASIVVTANQFIGHSMSCIQDSGSAIPENVLNTYCFFIGTNTWKEDTSDFPHKGIGPAKKGVEVMKHLYYQWVPYYLFFLALLFPSAHYIWKCIEQKILVTITSGFECVKYAAIEDKPVGDVPSISQRNEKIDSLANIIWLRIKNNLNNSWTLKLILAEIYACGVNLFIFWLTDQFLGGNGTFLFMTIDSAVRVFPTETSCTFYKYGPTGNIQNHDAFCILATNIVNYYIFLALRMLLFILIAVSALALVWRLFGACMYPFVWFNRITPFNNINNLIDGDTRRTIFRTLNYCDWVFINYVAENVDGMTFREVLLSIATHIKIENKNKQADDELKLQPSSHNQMSGYRVPENASAPVESSVNYVHESMKYEPDFAGLKNYPPKITGKRGGPHCKPKMFTKFSLQKFRSGQMKHLGNKTSLF
ncbi:Hypothetical predicted protein [Cloeon dipterum]|uniref:Innexin n=1 Tax=Cloeon dipterum TaxID=197152 RepID=A0A8S1DVJ3_9INSE|nr:Hypothetical predicted protein [Cloeon dipterum]